MDSITHAQNYNNKLLCEFFPDVRLNFPNRFTIGNEFEHHLDGVGFVGYAKVAAAKVFDFKYITDSLSYQVFGQQEGYMRKMLQQFYDYKLKPDSQLVHIIWKFTQRNPESLFPLFSKPWDKIISQTPGSAQYHDGPHLIT